MAWSRMNDLFNETVYLWFRTWGFQPSDAANLVQEVFISVMKSVASFKRKSRKDTFTGWLRVIARNKANDFYRKRHDQALGGTDAKQRFHELSEIKQNSFDDPIPEGSVRLVVQKVMNEIRDSTQEHVWEAFWLITVVKMKSREVAEKLGITDAAARKAASRISARLKAELEELVGEFSLQEQDG